MSERPKTMWLAVLQSQLCHPDWGVEEHLGWLEQEWYPAWSLGRGTGEDRREVLARWLRENIEAGRAPRGGGLR